MCVLYEKLFEIKNLFFFFLNYFRPYFVSLKGIKTTFKLSKTLTFNCLDNSKRCLPLQKKIESNILILK